MGRTSYTTTRALDRPPANVALDWLMTFAGIWTISGLFIDGHHHLFENVETFFNPWHAIMYSGGLFAVLTLTWTALKNQRAGYPFWRAVPEGYQQSMVGVAFIIIGGAADMVWHAFFGFEHQLDLLVSPPHLVLLTALFFVVTGPVRSALTRADRLSTLASQLPMLICMGLAAQTLQFMTQIAFYPEALMRDRPLSQTVYQNDQFALSAFLFYRQALEMIIVIWQSVLLAAIVLYVAARFRLALGAFFILCVAEKLWIGADLSRDWGEFALVIAASAAAGILADVIMLQIRPSLERPNAFRLLAFAVPALYFCAYFLLAVPMFGGTWWNMTFVFGAIVEAGIAGVCVSQLFLSGFAARSAA
ncbi:MAG: hypothetical protein JO135_05830 [Candidatus Eremiobacteraeota bacterium]|nr:hypothetical protein [Candidatus Eremiobacteraeota bacterium]